MTDQVTPYDLIFGTSGFDEERFELVREQDAAPVASAADLLMLPAAGELLRELLPAEHGAAHREAVARAGALLFHAYRFWRTGRRVYRFTQAALGPLLDPPPAVSARSDPPRAADDWTFRVPHEAGYVQLPRNALWARVAEDAAPEPVDGFFWSAPGPAGSPARLDLLLALGVRRGRPGVSLVEVNAVSSVGLEQWARTPTRPEGTDFGNILPGGELQGYHALTTHAEALKLAVLCFHRIAADAAGVAADADAPGSGDRVVVIDG